MNEASAGTVLPEPVCAVINTLLPSNILSSAFVEKVKIQKIHF